LPNLKDGHGPEALPTTAATGATGDGDLEPADLPTEG